jgi:hypothetical protein
MTNAEIARQRLANQHLALADFAQPGEVVGWFGAVQAQDYAGSLWAVGLRMRAATAAAIEQALAAGSIVRTHPMRGTWHYVAAADVRWLLALMAPRNLATYAYRYRQLELDAATLAKSTALFAKVLRGGKQLTRQELAAMLTGAGIAPTGQRLAYLLMHAELNGVICNGARRGKQFTYALLDDLVPGSRSLTREEAVAELVRRYFTSHGPATMQDFVWWSSLPTADARAALAVMSPHLTQEVIGGQTYWLASSAPSAPAEAPTAYLLPPYDEYTVAYTDRSAVLDPAYAQVTRNGIFEPIMVVDGLVAGTWKSTLKKNTVLVATSPFLALSEAQERAVAAAGERYKQFVGMGAGEEIEEG